MASTETTPETPPPSDGSRLRASIRQVARLALMIPPVSGIIKWYKGTPFGRREHKVWRHPADPESDAAYQEKLHWDGFISPMHWEEDDLTMYPAIMQDLRDLDEYLLPVFWEYNQRARYYQHKYYYYQWVFIIGAFLTTVMGSLATFFSADVPPTMLGVTITTVSLLGYDTGWSMVWLFSIATTIVSSITSYFTLLSNQGEPRKRWASYRRLAEELRMLYFRFISRLEPFDRPNRVEMLRKRVLEIRELEPSTSA